MFLKCYVQFYSIFCAPCGKVNTLQFYSKVTFCFVRIALNFAFSDQLNL